MNYYQNDADGLSYIGDDFLLSFITQEYSFKREMDGWYHTINLILENFQIKCVQLNGDGLIC